jgi:hypothetical protein
VSSVNAIEVLQLVDDINADPATRTRVSARFMVDKDVNWDFPPPAHA